MGSDGGYLLMERNAEENSKAEVEGVGPDERRPTAQCKRQAAAEKVAFEWHGTNLLRSKGLKKQSVKHECPAAAQAPGLACGSYTTHEASCAKSCCMDAQMVVSLRAGRPFASVV